MAIWQADANVYYQITTNAGECGELGLLYAADRNVK